jgi:hypothetical protein
MSGDGRRLRRLQEGCDGSYTVDTELAEILVEAAIAFKVEDVTLADQMRRAVGGEALGERNPDQLDLF